MIPLRQSTASQEVPLGYFLDSTNGDDEEVALSIANTDIKLWKSGATSLVSKNSGGATHMSNGIYYAVLDDTDTNTLGALSIFVHKTGALATRLDCWVYPANVYDAMIAGTDLLQVDTTQIEGTDATSQLDTSLTSYDAATGAEVAAIAADTAAILLDTGSDGVQISSATMQAIADEVLKRGVGNVEDSADANSLAAIVLATFFGEIAGASFNVYKTDGATLFGTTSVVTDENALPIISVGV